MPVLNGIDAAREMRDRGLLAPILLITTFEPVEFAGAARAAGATAVLLKDESPDKLVTAVRSVATGAADPG
jgi:NarL family two-component system response regulator LiaR